MLPRLVVNSPRHFVLFSTPNMTGRRFHRTMEMIPARPWKSKSPSVSTPINKVQNKGTQGVRARYGAELPPFISIVRYPGRPVILGMDFCVFMSLANQGCTLSEFIEQARGARCSLLAGPRQWHVRVLWPLEQLTTDGSRLFQGCRGLQGTPPPK